MDNLNDRYENIVYFFNLISSKFCEQNGIKLHIEIPGVDKLNAGVKKVGEKEYLLQIYPGCLNLDYDIEKITKRYSEDDLIHFSRFKHLGIFERFEEDTYREELNNLFATVILLHIFWHEIGHICAGYADRLCEYVEFDSTREGNYAKQEQEMVADWLGTKQVFQLFYLSAIYGKVKETDELIIALQQLVELYWLALTIEFQIFDSRHTGEVEDFSTLDHPYPAVRLLYNIEAMAEAIMDIFNDYGLDDIAAEKGMNILVNDIYVYIQSFLLITDCPINLEKDEERIMECYLTLRELPYSAEYEKNEFGHLQPLSDSYKEIVNKFLHG